MFSNLGRKERGHQHVSGLEVAVDDTALRGAAVQVRHATRNVRRQAQQWVVPLQALIPSSVYIQDFHYY